jgi:hypothetical protein
MMAPSMQKRAVHRNLWPTSTSTLGTNGGLVTPTKAREGGTLIEAVSARTQWPTPCGGDHKGPNPLDRRPVCDDDLPTRVKREQWPTPSARDWRSGKATDAIYNARSRPLSEVIERTAGGPLSPLWVEWLMGINLGWTDVSVSPDFALSVMPSSLKSRKSSAAP